MEKQALTHTGCLAVVFKCDYVERHGMEGEASEMNDAYCALFDITSRGKLTPFYVRN